MRKHIKAERFRAQFPGQGCVSPKGVDHGAFIVPCKQVELRIISSGSDPESGWEHVSVSLPDRCPTWGEMCFVKNLFWSPGETVMQFHPAASRYINQHEYCLHLWREVGKNAPLPPSICV